MSFVGPQIRPTIEKGFMGGAGEGPAAAFDHLAVSPDGETVYLTQMIDSPAFKQRHGVFKVKWGDKELGAPFLGKDDPGADDEHFNDPQGIATDKTGNVYVCDRANNRVMVFSAEGKLLGKFAADSPEQIAVHPAGGDIFILSKAKVKKGEKAAPTRLLKFSPWGKGDPKELARREANITLMAVDPEAIPAKLWVTIYDGYGRPLKLSPVADKGNQLEIGQSVTRQIGLDYPMFLAGDAQRNRVLVRDRGGPSIVSLDLASGKITPFANKGEDVAMDREGNAYVLGNGKISRYDPAGKPLPFAGSDSNQMEVVGGYASYGPTIGLRGHCVTPNGDIYIMRSNKWTGGVINRVDVYGPDGKLKKANLVDGLQAGDCGVGVDAAGNVYVGVNIKPKDRPLPAYCEGKVPANPWAYWRKDLGEHLEVPWLYPYQNPYLNHLGSVIKFGPEGGAIFGLSAKPQPQKDQAMPPDSPLYSKENAPAGSATYWSANLKTECRVKGALWRYAGMGIVPGDFGWGDPGCICWNSHLAVDEYGRVFAPNAFRFSVEMLDTNGNQIARIGRYGNADSAGPGSALPEPQIAFAFPMNVSVSCGKLFVSDPVNRRITVVMLDHAAEDVCDIR